MRGEGGKKKRRQQQHVHRRLHEHSSDEQSGQHDQQRRHRSTADIGELVVEIYQPDSMYSRGIVGLGEPPVIGGGAAISNAVANAIGVRVPVLPLTPKRILDALAKA